MIEKVAFCTTFSFRTPVAVLCYDPLTEKNARKEIHNGKIKTIHCVWSETCLGDRKKLQQSHTSIEQ